MHTYRTEIDGLRALALLPVIFYHAGLIHLTPGGYIGVDVFFVISGYLITSIIDDDIKKETFSLIHFYERRCRRILPVLYVISFISAYIAYYWMPYELLEESAYSLISILTFSSNIFFWWKDSLYFSQRTEFNPVIHTWSLAVEEQFYLVFPLVCYLLANKKRSYLMIILGFTAFGSFFLAQWGGNLQISSSTPYHMFLPHTWATFYMPIGRIWELLIGAFAAFYLNTNNDDNSKKSSNIWTQFFALIGLILIIASVILLDNRIIPPFPNCYTALPTFGTALVIVFGNYDTLVGRVLSTRPLRGIGFISYSAYLWHQPLLVYFRLQKINIQNISFISSMIIVILLIATLSYFFVEQPFRNQNRFSRKNIFHMSWLGALIIFLIALFLIKTSNKRSLTITAVIDNHSIVIDDPIYNRFLIINRTSNNISLNLHKEVDTFMYDIEHLGYPYYVNQKFHYRMKDFLTFSEASAKTNRRLLIVGDSFGMDLLTMIVETNSLSNYEIRCHFVSPACQIYVGPEDRLNLVYQNTKHMCINDNDVRFGLSLIRQANVIILAAYWEEWSIERLPKTLELLNITQNQKLFVLGSKNFGVPINVTFYKNKSYEFRVNQYQQPCTYALKRNDLLKKTLDKSIFIDVINMTCSFFNHTCPLFTPEGKLISLDGLHTTQHYGARYLGKIILNRVPLNQL
ncbi:hypothetical protein I4U23_015228 [Adineta vaga]|nr:hypothetical protein I4U23_015228 [Adineta vaga]